MSALFTGYLLEQIQYRTWGGGDIASAARNGSFRLVLFIHHLELVVNFLASKKRYLKSFELHMVKCKDSSITIECVNECLL